MILDLRPPRPRQFYRARKPAIQTLTDCTGNATLRCNSDSLDREYPYDDPPPTRFASLIVHDGPQSPSSDTTRGSASSRSNEASILVVAEHALVRAGLKALLNATSGLVVVADAATIDAATRIASQARPDVVVLDPPSNAAISAHSLSALRRAVPDACVLCLARNAPGDVTAMRCVPPDSDVAEFCSTLGSMLGDRCAACLLRPQCQSPRIAVALSRREQQVAVRVARGMSSKQIAATLGIKLRTVNTHRENLARKIGASSSAVVTRYVLEHGLLGLPESHAL